MTKKKSNKYIDVFKIFFGSIKLYFLYLDKLVKYLAFPVFGQLFSIIIIGCILYFYLTNYDAIKSFLPVLNSDSNVFIALWIVLLPFIIVFLKAFYDYLIAFAALNIVFYTISPSKKKLQEIDFVANNLVIERKIFKYILLWLLVSIIFLVLMIPIIGWIFIPFMIIGLSLVFQVFTFEQDVSPVSAIKRAFNLVQGNYMPTFILLLLMFVLTYWFVPTLFLWAAEKVSVISYLSSFVERFINLFPVYLLNDALDVLNIPIQLGTGTISVLIISTMIFGIFTAFMLPLRCCCFSMLYKIYDCEKIAKNVSSDPETSVKVRKNR